MPRATRQPVEVRPLVTGVGLVWARSERLTERYPVFPDLGMEVLRGQFDAQLIGSGEQLARDPDQEGSNRLRLPALERGISAQQGHPAEGVVGKYRTLEQRRVGQEMVGFQLCKSHLVLGFFDPSLRGGPLAVGTVGLPGAEWFGGDVTEVLVLRQWEEFALRMIRRRCLAAAYGDQEPAVLPIVGQAL